MLIGDVSVFESLTILILILILYVEGANFRYKIMQPDERKHMDSVKRIVWGGGGGGMLGEGRCM